MSARHGKARSPTPARRARRIFSPIYSALLLAACGDAEPAPAPQGVAIACALDGAAALESRCILEEAREGEREVLVLHRPDGGFRRVERGADGAFAAYDGADALRQRASDAGTLLAIGRDVYRLPPSLATGQPR